MHKLGYLLSTLGGNGPILLVASLIAGVASSDLAHGGYYLLPVSAFLLTLGSFLAAGLAPSEIKTSPSLFGIVLAWLGVGIPLIAAAVLSATSLNPALRAGLLLSLLAPPVGSAAAIAAMLGLQTRLALLSSIVLTLAAPFTMTGFASLLGLGISIEMSGLALRLFAIVGTAATVAFVALHFRGPLRALLPDQRAGTGVAVIGLIIVGLAMSQGVRSHWNADPVAFQRILAAAILVNLSVSVVGTAVFSQLGLRTATTIGLVSGNRNVTLAWAVSGFGLPATSEAYLAACVVPVLVLPLAVSLTLRFGQACNRVSKSRWPQMRRGHLNG
jgi:arsenite transporter